MISDCGLRIADCAHPKTSSCHSEESRQRRDDEESLGTWVA